MPDETPASPAAAVVAATPPAAGPQTVPMPLDQLQALLAAQTRLAEIEGVAAVRRRRRRPDRGRGRDPQRPARGGAAAPARAIGGRAQGRAGQARRGREPRPAVRTRRRAPSRACRRRTWRAPRRPSSSRPSCAASSWSRPRARASPSARRRSSPWATSSRSSSPGRSTPTSAAPARRRDATPRRPGRRSRPASTRPPTRRTRRPRPRSPANMGERVILHMQGLQKTAGDPRQYGAAPGPAALRSVVVSCQLSVVSKTHLPGPLWRFGAALFLVQFGLAGALVDVSC